MLKAADALHAAGYRVRVVGANHTAWATAADREIMTSRGWRWTVVDYARATAPVARLTSGARFKAAERVAAAVGAQRAPPGLAVRAFSRIHDELVRAVVSEPADVIYGGTTGALAAAAESAAALGVPFGVDFEDFHSGEHAGDAGMRVNALAERIEHDVTRSARFVTAGSALIAETYCAKYRIPAVPIHNTFSIRFGPERGAADAELLRLYWFSQTIGPGRGLEDLVRACGRVSGTVALHLRGCPAREFATELRAIQREAAPSLTIVHHEPANPDAMVELAQPYDAGLSCEETIVANRSLCLSNKVFTYLAAGVPVILSRTRAQEQLAADLGAAAVLYDVGDVDGLGAQLNALAADADGRRRARAAAREAATRRWHWEHPLDRGALLALVEKAVG